MSDEIQEMEVIDATGDGGSTNTAVADAPEQSGWNDENFDAMQQRMAGNDSPFLSSSDGLVHDKDGDVLLNAKTGKPISSMEEYQQLVAQDKAAQNAAKPKIEQKQTPRQPVKPMSRSFSSFMGSGGEVTPELLQEMAKAGGDYQYQDDLLPKIQQQTGQRAPAVQQEQPVDPLVAINDNRKQWESIAINPIEEIRNALIANGAAPDVADSIIGPILQKNRSLVEEVYRGEYEKAMRSSLEGQFKPTLTKLEQEKLENASSANVNALASKYYPQGGKEQFFALINGHYDDKGNFVRGPAAQVIDLMASIMNNGKKFSSQEELSKAFGDTFRQITSDTSRAKALFDIAHYYWIGKQNAAAQNVLYQKGKAAAQKEAQLAKRTIKTKPATYQQPSSVEEDENMPGLLRASMGLPLKR